MNFPSKVGRFFKKPPKFPKYGVLSGHRINFILILSVGQFYESFQASLRRFSIWQFFLKRVLSGVST